MFEKEAEVNSKNYAFTICLHNGRVRKSGKQIAVENYIKGAEFGYNKANEWHYVKDGDLPKENKKYWVLTSAREPKVDSWLSISWVNSYDIIAWKEIVLPEESE